MSDSQAIIHLEDGWNDEIKPKALIPLERMLDDGFKGKTKLFTNKEYVNIYTICYNMCTQRSPYNWSEQLYQRHGEQLSNFLTASVVPKLQNQRDEFLLRQLVISGENHKIMNKWYKNFFMYLDRYYVKYHALPTLEDAGKRHFKTLVFEIVKKDACAAILALVDVEREGGTIDRSLIKSCIQLFEDMGMGSLEVYVSDFEHSLLDSTRIFYARKSSAWLQDDSTPDYLIKAELVLEEEKQRVLNYFNQETEGKLLRVIEEEILVKKETELLEKEGSGCRVLLMNDMLDDLSRIYRLFSRVPNGLNPIADILRQHILNLGNDKIEQRVNRTEEKEEKDRSDDPEYIKEILSLHDKFILMVNSQFSGNSLFQKALKDAFVEIVNKDVGKFRTADLLSSFVDRLLKTGSNEKLSDEEIEEYLEKTVQLFSYLTDKDVFAEIYRNQLAKRLLDQRSASDDMEKLMIGKLKLRCGAQYTGKMEGMLNDLSIGLDHAKNFDDHCKVPDVKQNLGKAEFAVQVLTTGYWPSYRVQEVVLPPIMAKCTQVFKDFYDSQTTHRRLQWIHVLGNVTVKATYGKKSYDLQVTTLQAVVLMAFNIELKEMAFNELLNELNIPDDILKRVLHSLVCGKYRLLKKVDEISDKGGIKVTDAFIVNDQFSCPMRKIRIPMASLEESHNVKRVEEDRTNAIEAAIVRIMKARKALAHQQLIAEVLTQLAFFRPDPKLIKRKIESLIDREYLERDPDSNNTYRYLA